jgi:hypothetical protein
MILPALERPGIGFLVHETSGAGIAFYPAIGFRVMGLGAATDCAIAVSVASRGIGSYVLYPHEIIQ